MPLFDPKPLLVAGSRVYLRGSEWLIDKPFFMARDAQLIGPGTVRFTDPGAFLRVGELGKLRGFINLVGAMNQTQFVEHCTGDDLHLLDPGARYCIRLVEGFSTAPVWLTVETLGIDGDWRKHALQQPGPWHVITDATALRITVVGDAYRLSRLDVLRLVNDIAAASLVNGIDDGTHVDCYSNGAVIEDCRFSLMPGAAAKLVNSTGSVIRRCKVSESLGGFTTQGGRNNQILDNTIDVHVGGYATGWAARNHGIAIGGGERSTNVERNTMRGASWAYENAEMDVLSQDIKVNMNSADAIHVGYSACATRGVVTSNEATLSALAWLHYEMPTAIGARVENNTSQQAIPAGESFGLAYSSRAALDKLTARYNEFRGARVGAALNGPASTKGISANRLQYWDLAVRSDQPIDAAANAGFELLAAGRSLEHT